MSGHSVNSSSLDWQGMDEDNFFDGRKKIIPDGAILECEVIDGFNGPEIGKITMVCNVWLRIVADCEYRGQVYKFSPKIYDNDVTKRDRGNIHLDVIDAAAGDPLTRMGLELTTENMQAYWSGAILRVKFGFIKPEIEGESGNNFVAGVALTPKALAERKAAALQQAQASTTTTSQKTSKREQPKAQPDPEPDYEDPDDSNIDF